MGQYCKSRHQRSCEYTPRLCCAVMQSFAISHSFYRSCIDLVLRLCSKADLDPMALLRSHLRRRFSSHAPAPTLFSSHHDQRLSKLQRIARLCRERDGDFVDLVRCLALVLEYRLVLRTLRKAGMDHTEAVRLANSVIQDESAAYSLRAGDQALPLCWAISPRCMFGAVILAEMSLSKAEIHDMNKATRAAFIMLFSGHWIPTTDDVPSPVCAAVIEMARTIIPAAE
jgi:hypothetical protein